MKVIKCSERKQGRGNVCLCKDNDGNFVVANNLSWFSKEDSVADTFENEAVAIEYYNSKAKHPFGEGF